MKKQVKEAVQKRNKSKSAIYPGGQTVIVLDDDDDDEEPKVKKTKRKKKKHLEIEKGADEGRTKKKKHSKLNKGYADHSLGIESSSDLRSVKEAEKIIIKSSSDSESRKEAGKACKVFKKKGEQGGTRIIPNEDQSEASEEIHFLSRKISKRTVLVNQGDDQDFAPKKKKKRKHQPNCEETRDKSQKPFSKKPKLTTQERELLREHKRGPVFTNTRRDCDVVKKKHKGSCSLASVDCQRSRHGIGGEGKARTANQLKRESGCQDRAWSCGQHHENGVEKETIQRKVKKKRKRKRKEKVEAEDDVSVLADHDGGDSENGGMEDVPNLDLERGCPVKKKKKRQTQSENICPVRVEDIGGPTSGKDAPVERVRKKKKAKKDKGVQENHCGFMKDLSELRVGKGMKMQNSREKLMWKKIKVETEEAKEEEEEIEVVTIKEGNCDEISIDMLRRQALQDEIDQESGKTKAAKEEAESDAHFGQWSTATFESLERKNKFLRLLGSFKSGSTSTRNSSVHTTKPNMALPQAGEKHLLQNLQAEFDKARDLKPFRGVGLGFQPIAPKRMYIDKHASKSIKFES